MADLNPQTKEVIVQGIVGGAGGNDPDGIETLRPAASFLFQGGVACAILGVSALAVSLMVWMFKPVRISLGGVQPYVYWEVKLFLFGFVIFISGILLRGLVVLLVIERYLREVRDHLRKQ